MLNKIIPKSEFVRNVLSIMSGTTISQSISIGLTPLLTRVYSPKEFGLFALYMSIASLFSVCATGRYELAIMLPEKDENAANIIVLSTIIAFLFSIISFLIILFFNAEITSLLNNEDIKNWLYLIPISIFFTGLYQSINYWANRKKQFRKIAINKVVQTSSVVSFKLGAGFNGGTSFGLIIGTIFGQIISTLFLGKIIWKKDSSLFLNAKKTEMLLLAKEYKKMPIFNLPNTLVDGVRNTGIRSLLAKFFSTSALGQFSLSWNMLQLPMSIVGGSMAQVLFQKLSIVKPGNMVRILIKFIKKAVLIPLLPFLFLFFYSEPLFIFVFGSQWDVAGEIATLLIPWVYMNFITSPISTIFIIHNKQDRMLIFGIIFMLVPLILILNFHNQGILNLIKIVSFTMAFLLFLFLIMAYFVAKDFDKKIK